MLVSTRGRYALRVMIDLAEHSDGVYVAMKEVAQRQQISLKYLERILPMLVEARLVEGVRGKGGGYRLTREPDEYTLSDILLAAEGDLAPISCLEKNAPPCERAGDCRTLPMWRRFDDMVHGFFYGITLKDLMEDDAPAGQAPQITSDRAHS
jgi:Rrf2 family protein